MKYSYDNLGGLRYQRKNLTPIYKYAYLKHYTTKSSEEYTNKILREDAVFLTLFINQKLINNKQNISNKELWKNLRNNDSFN